MSYDVKIVITNLKDGEFIEREMTVDTRWGVAHFLAECADDFWGNSWDFEGDDA